MMLLMAMLLIGTSFQALVRNYLTEQAMEGLKNDGRLLGECSLLACQSSRLLSLQV